MPKRNRDSSMSLSSSLPMSTIPPQSCPEAIRVWATSDGKTKDSVLVREKARNHLLATGWSFFRARKSNDYMELRYQSPAGNVFHSLLTACKSIASQTLDVDSSTSSVVIPETTTSSSSFCMKASSRKRRKIRMRSMEDILNDERSLLSNVDRVLGKPSQVKGRSDLTWTLPKSEFVIPETTTSSSSFCMKASSRKRRKIRMRSMEDILNDERSLLSNVDRVLGKPSQVKGRSDLTWTLLKSESKENKIHNFKLNQALEVMHHCFQPSDDPVTHRDVAEDIIFNRGREFYTVVLEMGGDTIVTAANVKIHGVVAEVPLMGTAYEFRRQGMCRILMNEIEDWLRDSGVERLVLPSVQSALTTWTSPSIGFSTMTEDEKDDFLSAYDCLDFQDTVMCEKQLLKKDDKARGYDSDGSTISHEDYIYADDD